MSNPDYIARGKRLRSRRSTSKSATDLKQGRIGLAQNRLPANIDHRGCGHRRRGRMFRNGARKSGILRVLAARRCAKAKWPSLRWQPAPAAAGLRAPAWSRPCIPSAGWADVTGPLLRCIWRKSRGSARSVGTTVPHVFTTSYLTHAPTEAFLARQRNYGYRRPAVSFAAANPSACAWCPWSATCVSLWEEIAAANAR